MKNSLLKNTLVIGIGKISTQFLAFLLVPLYTAFLSPEEFGIGDLIITYVSLLAPLVTLGLEQGMFRLLVDARKNRAYTTTILSTGLRVIAPIFLILLVIALTLGFSMNNLLIIVAALYVAATILVRVLQWVARGRGDNTAFSVGSIVAGGVAATGTVVLIVGYDMGVNGMLAALAIGNLVGAAYFVLRLRLKTYVSVQTYDKKIAKQLIAYSLPLIPNDISWWALGAADRTIIALSLGVAATGVYAVAIKFPAILAALFAIFWAAWYEAASVHADSPKKAELYSKTINTSISFFGSLSLVILAVVPLLFPLMVGSEFADAYKYIPPLLLGAFFGVIAKGYGAIYAASRNTVRVLTTTIVSAVVGITTVAILVGFIGLYAAAIAAVVANATMLIIRHLDVTKNIAIQIYYKKVILIVGLSCIAVVLYYTNMLWLNIINVAIMGCALVMMNRNVLSSLREVVWKRR